MFAEKITQLINNLMSGEGSGLWHQWADLLISVVYIYYNWYILISHFSPIDIRPSLTFSMRDSIFHMKCLGDFLQFIKANSIWSIILLFFFVWKGANLRQKAVCRYLLQLHGNNLLLFAIYKSICETVFVFVNLYFLLFFNL